jgi:PAS domain S-box-containing protein
MMDQHLESQGFWRATLDALDGRVAVLDEHGIVVVTNASWDRFAAANGGECPTGADYLAVGEAAVDDRSAASIALGVRAVLSGEQGHFVFEYPCQASDGERWFRLRAERQGGHGDAHVVICHLDITADHEAARQAHVRADLLDVVDAAVIATDRTGCVRHWNAGAERMLGWTSDEAIGRPITELAVLPADRAEAAAIRANARDAGRWEGRFTAARRDGSTFPAFVRNVLIHDHAGAVDGVVGVMVDVTATVEAEDRLRAALDFFRAVTDSMGDGVFALNSSGFPVYLNSSAEKLLGWTLAELTDVRFEELIHRRAPPASVLVGDQSIASAGPAGGAARTEGDSFICRDGTHLPVSYTVDPLEMVDGMLGSVYVFSDITERLARERRLRHDLEALSTVERIRAALDDDRLVLYAQPIVQVANRETVQHELLVRMIGPEGEIIEPGAFLPAAEDFGLMGAIDRRVFELAMSHPAAGHRVQVNVSAASIGDPDFLRFVQARIEERRIDAQLLVFELTETALINNEEAAKAFIETVRGWNSGVALDDFGSGYASFRYLKQLPVTLLKIDREFVGGLDSEDSAANLHVIKAIVSLGQGMGQKTIAEGVETEATYQILRELGVDYAQGYLFARPASADDVFGRLVSHNSAAGHELVGPIASQDGFQLKH